MDDGGEGAVRVLEYGVPERGFRSWWRRHVPRFSGRTFLLLLLAGAAAFWLARDHDAWVVERTFPPGTSALRITADGRRVMVGSYPGAAGAAGATGPFQVFDTVSGTRISSFGWRHAYANDAMFSPDGARIVTVGTDIIETVSEEPGRTTVSRRASSDRPVARLWDVATGKLIAELGELGPVNSSYGNPRQVHFSPDGKRIVTLENERARLFDGVTGKYVAELEGRAKPDGFAFVGDGVWFSPDGAKVVVRTGGYQHVRVRSTEDGRLLAQLWPAHPTPNGIRGAFSPDGSTFAFSDYGWLYAIDASTGKERWPAVNVGGNAGWVGYSPDGTGVFVLHQPQSADALTRLDATTGRVRATTRPYGGSTSWPLRWSPDGRTLATFPSNGTVEIYDPSNLQLVHKIARRDAGDSVSFFSGDGRRGILLADRPRMRMEIVDTATWRVRSEIRDRWRAMQGILTDATFVGGDARRVLTATDTGVTRLWRLRRPEAWWGVVALAPFWAAAAAAGLFAWSAAKDVGKWRRGE